jgi:cytoskeletal protein RodZ
MSDIGSILREAREEQGLTLAEAEEGTRIRARFLEALENNDFDVLPGAPYVRGFTRNYASFLGVDPAPLLAQLKPGQEPIKFPLAGKSTEPRLLSEPLQPNPVPFGRIIFVLAVLVGIAALALTLWWQPVRRDAILAQFGITLPQVAVAATNTPPPPTEQPVTEGAAGGATQAIATRVVTQTLVIIEPNREATPVPTATLPPRTPSPNPSATATEEPTPAPQEMQGVVVTAEIIERTWTEVYLDMQQEPVVYRVLEPGESYEWVGQDELYLRVGNAAGIRITVNGEDLGVLGGQGGLVVRRWQRNPDGGPPLLVESQG